MNGLRRMLAGKIHRARVTHADLEYEGSLSIPPDLMEAAGILEHEAISVWNVNNGARLETYAIRGVEGRRDLAANGAAAHLIRPEDLVIIAAFTWLPDEAAREHEPRVVFVNEHNEITQLGPELAGPLRR